jgi:F0F1-type ATP synthase membrane subunit a
MTNILIHVSIEKISYFLLSFIIILEILSNILKPLTLIIRLTINLFTGHLILELVANFSLSVNFLLNSILHCLEIIIRFIQALVFNIIILLFFRT